MNRLLRRARRGNTKKLFSFFSDLFPSTQSPVRSRLVAEELESRLLLTTLTLPAGATTDTVFVYADPEGADSGGSLTSFNEIHIGTLSGIGPSQDVIVEILDYAGRDIGGTYTVNGQTVNVFGGPGGGRIIEQVPGEDPNLFNSGVGFLNESIDALATNSSGQTYGLTRTGHLVRIDTARGVVDLDVGLISDTDTPTGTSYSGYSSATFAKNSSGQDILYAVVNSPLTFDALGNPTSRGSALITINTATGEADPVGVDSFGQPNYAASAVTRLVGGDNDIDVNITTIVFSQEGQNPTTTTDEPVFLSYDTISDKFVYISVNQAGGGGEVIVTTVDSVGVEEVQNDGQPSQSSIVIAGLMYDVQGRLLGLRHTTSTTGVAEQGTLVQVNLAAPVAGRFTDVIGYGKNPHDNDILLTGMTYDPLNGKGFATDPNSQTLYVLNVDRMMELRNDQGAIEGFFISGMADIYMVYVAQSTPDTYITFTYFDVSQDKLTYRPTGGEPAFMFIDDDDEEIFTPDNAGGVMIGTRPSVNPDPKPGDDIDDIIWSAGDVWYVNANQFQMPHTGTFFNANEMSPDPGAKGAWPGGRFRPGIIVEAGQDIGKIQVGGAVFGDVDIRGGSIGTFYAGYLATNSFYVDGEINTLAIATEGGGRSESDNSWQSADEVIMEVQGNMGSFYVNEQWGVPLRVYGRSDKPKFPGVLDINTGLYVRGVFELERHFDASDDTLSAFMFGSLDRADGTKIFSNDSPYTAQYLGSVDDRITVFGDIEWEFPAESADFYSFGVMAGQEIKIELFNTLDEFNIFTGYPLDPDSLIAVTGSLTLYDPEINLVDMSGTVDLETNAPLPLIFTAQRGGIYTVAVSSDEYRMEISGVSPTTLGGGNVIGELRTGLSWMGTKPNVQVVSGNLGAISVGSYFRDGTIKVDQGSLGGLRAGANGMPPSDMIAIADVVTGETPELGFGYEVVPLGDNNIFGISELDVQGDVGGVYSIITSALNIFVGGDLQSLHIGGEIAAPDVPGGDTDGVGGGRDRGGDGGGGDDVSDGGGGGGGTGTADVFVAANYSGQIVADGNIGEIHISGSYGPDMPPELQSDDVTVIFPPHTLLVFANADGVGEPGIIDSIVVGGDFGRTNDFIAEIPVSTGRNKAGGAGGGNVRFVDIGGMIINSTGHTVSGSGFGPFTFEPGQSALIMDDSGTLVRISPGFTGLDEDELVFGLPTPDDTQDDPNQDDQDQGDGEEEEEDFSAGGVLTIKLLPIRDQLYEEYSGDVNKTALGYAIVDIQSTDGLRVRSEGGPVEIGSMTVEGGEDNAVAIYGTNDISVLRISVAPAEYESLDEEDREPGQRVFVTDGGEEMVVGVGITRISNNTDGDVVSIQIGDPGPPDAGLFIEEEGLPGIFELVRINGHLGKTYSTTGQIIVSKILSPLVELEDDDDGAFDATVTADPGGIQRSGLVSNASVNRIIVNGSLGDVDVLGKVNNIQVNFDKSRGVGQYDGVVGSVIVHADLEYIDLGDGIANVGTGRFAQGGVFVFGNINQVKIDGAGRDIEGPIFAGQSIGKISVTNGARLTYSNATSLSLNAERLTGAQFVMPTISVTTFFDDFWIAYGNFVSSGPIETIEVLGRDSEIYGTTIFASSVNTIRVNSGANGMFYAQVNTFGFTAESGVINKILVGGQGISNTLITASRELNNVTVARGGMIEDSEIASGFYVGSIIADEINRTDIKANNQLDKVTARYGIFDLTIEAGELGQLQAKESILGSAIYVGGPVNKIVTRGDFISTLVLTGPYSDLKSVTVGGDMGTPTGGIIEVDGKVGTIRVKGDFEAEMVLNWDSTPAGPGNPQGPHEKYPDRPGLELTKLIVGGRITSFGDIGGDVGTIQGGSDFGVFDQELYVHGDMKTFKVGSGRSSSDLRSDLTVDGDLGKMMVYGNVYGDINIMDDFKSLTLRSTRGGEANLYGDIVVGEDFNKLTILGGDQYGDITVGGSGPKKTIRGSDVFGTTTIVGDYPGEIIDGSITETGRYVVTGDVDTMHIKGDIDEGGLLVIQGDLGKLIVDGSIEGVVYVAGNIGSIIASNMGIDDQGQSASIIAGGDIDIINISGVMKDSYILAGFDPGAGGTVNLAEFDDTDPSASFDLSKFTLEGTLVDPREHALAGNIKSAKVAIIDNSVIAAGVGPGTNTAFGDFDGSDQPGTGLSKIGNVVIGSVVESDNTFGVFADTSIGKLKVAGRRFPTPLLLESGFHAWTIEEIPPSNIGGFTFQSGMPFKVALVGQEGAEKLVTVTLSGPGFGWVLLSDDASKIDAIQLSGTTRATSLKVMARGSQTVNVGRIFTSDDDSLNSLAVDGILGNVTGPPSLSIGGDVNKIKLAGMQGLDFNINGNVKSLDLGIASGTSGNQTTMTIVGQLGQLKANDIGSFTTITARNINTISVRNNMDGYLISRHDDVKSIVVRGGMDGVISSQGDIDKIMVKGITAGGIRAAGDIGTFRTSAMIGATVAAGGNFDQARITGDVRFSTLAAGLDIGVNGDPFSGADVSSGRGNIDKVLIGGDFLQSNITAGIAPGQDNMFGTPDDILERRTVEDINAPRIVNLEIEYNATGTDFDTIRLEFMPVKQGPGSNIGNVKINGDIIGSTAAQDHFAIIASGQIGSVMAHRQVFDGDDNDNNNVDRITVGSKNVLASTIERDSIGTLEDALASAFRIQTDGLDHVFASQDEVLAGAADDVIIYGDDVWVEFDQATNSALFHKPDGFATTAQGSNYYKIVLDSSIVVNRMGVELDGEFSGQWPSGNGVPGGDFVYILAVGDLGDSLVTAYSPFEQGFAENSMWKYSGVLGDNLKYTTSSSLQDEDYIRLNNLKEGQVLIVDSSTTSVAINLLRIQESAKRENTPLAMLGNGRSDLDPPRNLIVPNLDEFAYSGGVYYGYDDQGQSFYKLTRPGLGLSILPNNLNDINTLPEIASQASITHLRALAGHSGDSLWAIGVFQPDFGPGRESLVLINNISADVDIDSDIKLSIVTSSYDISVDFANIVGLAELNGTLYGIDAATDTLVTITSDPDDPDNFGRPTVVGAGLGNLGNEDLEIAGLAVAADTGSLVALHDQPANDFSNLLLDGLYEINTATGQAELMLDFSTDRELHGLAIDPGGAILIGIPLRGSPIGEIFNITYDNQTLEHVFGGSQETDFAGLVSINSNPVVILENAVQQNFIDGGFYYALDINYNTSMGDISLVFTDVAWFNDTDFGSIDDAVIDDSNVTAFPFNDGVVINISTGDGDGSARIYFAGAGSLLQLTDADLTEAGKIVGDDKRDDLDPVRDMLMPNLEELTIASQEITSISGISYEALGYDVDQEMFALIDIHTYDARPIMVEDLNNPNKQVPLTREILSDIYVDQLQNSGLNSNVIIDDIRGLEFGRIGGSDINELWAIATISQTNEFGETSTRDSLMKIDNILAPNGSIVASINNLSFNGFEQVTQLAFGNWVTADEDNGVLFGLDTASDTLIVIDYQQMTRDPLTNELISNVHFGKATSLDGQLGNLGNPGGIPYDITSMDFNARGDLLALDDNTDSLVEISTAVRITEESSRLELLQQLPQGSYQAISFDSTGNYGQAFIVRTTDGTPVGDLMDLSVKIGSTPSLSAVHSFGGTDTTVNSVTFSSDTDTGGFYKFDITYPQNQGTILLTVSDVNWSGTHGSVDSIQLSDEAFVNIASMDDDTFTLSIDSNFGSGQLTAYFGTTSQLLIPGAGVTSFPVGFGGAMQIPEDGDYVLRVYYQSFNIGINWFNWFNGWFWWFGWGFENSEAIDYDLDITLFNDSNSDFGINQTASGLLYNQVTPGDFPIDLGPNSLDLTPDPKHDDLFYYEHPAWPINVSGTLLTPGQESSVIIDTQLANSMDTDVYTFQLTQGQRVTVDIDSEILFGRDNMAITVGIYNGDLESLATINDETVDTMPVAQQVDSLFSAQAVFTMENHDEIIIDPMVDGVGTYYIVVSNGFVDDDGLAAGDLGDDIFPYRLTIETTDPQTVEIPDSQLVWLSFGDRHDGTNATADFLLDDLNGLGQTPDVVNRPAFFASEFGLDESVRKDLINAIAARIEQIYRDAGLAEDEIEFVTEKPALGKIYSTIIFGGDLAVGASIAEQLDRHNSDRTDMAVVSTLAMGNVFQQVLDDDPDVRFLQVMHSVATTGAHELGHILGLEHATEINTTEPNNIMGYNFASEFEEQNFEERNSYMLNFGPGASPFQIGFENEIDLLLRNIGSGTPMGS